MKEDVKQWISVARYVFGNSGALHHRGIKIYQALIHTQYMLEGCIHLWLGSAQILVWFVVILLI